MCRAFDRTIHIDCFQCSTCGTSLNNEGHHFINDKFYCDIHGRQLKGSGIVKSRDEISWSTAYANFLSFHNNSNEKAVSNLGNILSSSHLLTAYYQSQLICSLIAWL